MSTSPVVRMDAYRGRRERRLRLARALWGAHGGRRELIDLLEEAARLLDADRAAVLWVDEYGSGLVHVHALLDLLSDRPRRSFPLEPLRLAWREGVPGILDAPDMERCEIPVLHDLARSACAVALGSDGARSWFLVVDSASRRQAMAPDVAESLMFIAGEASAVVLHRDMGKAPDLGAAPAAQDGSAADAGAGHFSGWSVLQDMEGREEDAAAAERISARFMVARALLSVIDEDFASDPEALKHQIDATRREVRWVLPGDPEAACWEAVLDALETCDVDATGPATLALARRVEEMGHTHGAATFYRAAYEVAGTAADGASATEAARLLARLERLRGDWEAALRWYGVAREVARERGDRRGEAVVLTGWGGVLRARGSLPAARATYLEALGAARDSGDAYALGSAHHDLMAVEQDVGSFGRAIVHGWRAVEVYPEEESRLKAMTSLAGCFLATGELDAAEDAYAIVLARVRGEEYRYAAREALAHVAARRGRAHDFEALAETSDRSGWEAGAGVWTTAQILLFRGLSHEALDRVDDARAWLERAVAFAESNDVNKVVFDAEEALARLEGRDRPDQAGAATEAARPPDEMPEIRSGLSAMREALVSA